MKSKSSQCSNDKIPAWYFRWLSPELHVLDVWMSISLEYIISVFRQVCAASPHNSISPVTYLNHKLPSVMTHDLEHAGHDSCRKPPPPPHPPPTPTPSPTHPHPFALVTPSSVHPNGPPSHWSLCDSLVPHHIGPFSLVPHYIVWTHWSPFSLVPLFISPPILVHSNGYIVTSSRIGWAHTLKGSA